MQLEPDGYVRSSDSTQGDSFYYVHWYKFLLLYWLNVLTDGLCVEKGDMDIAYLTELDPTWHDDELTFLLNPEAALFASLPAQVACSADSLATLAGLPALKIKMYAFSWKKEFNDLLFLLLPICGLMRMALIFYFAFRCSLWCCK